MARPRTRAQTLYRLPSVAASPEGMFDALDDELLDSISADVQPIEIAGVPALWVAGQFERSLASWCADASATTGLPLAYGDIRSAGLLLLAVDQVTYALGYGDGHRLIPDDLKDQRFGLRFVVRRVDPKQVQGLARRLPGTRGRTDVTMIPGGLPVWSLGVEEHAEIIRRLGGRSQNLEITFSRTDQRPVRVDGSVGLSMRFGTDPVDLINDIREVARVCAEERPHPDLEFVDNIHPIQDQLTQTALEAEFVRLLRDEHEASFVAATVPTSLLDDLASAHTFQVKIGSAPPRLLPEADLDYILMRTRRQEPGNEIPALRDGFIQMFADVDGQDALGRARAIKWLEATVSIGARRFFLLDGEWYEIDANYLDTHCAEVARILEAQPSLDLPAWDLGWTEAEYNEWVPTQRHGYVRLDRRGLHAGLHQRTGVEVCDLLGPGDELVHVKRAHASAPLSHLFSQGLVSAQALLYSPGVRADFTAAVQRYGKGRVVPEDFTPKKIVYAILLKGGERLTTDTLFPFSQVTLVHTARTLEARGIAVEVVGINAAPKQAS